MVQRQILRSHEGGLILTLANTNGSAERRLLLSPLRLELSRHARADPVWRSFHASSGRQGIPSGPTGLPRFLAISVSRWRPPKRQSTRPDAVESVLGKQKNSRNSRRSHSSTFGRSGNHTHAHTRPGPSSQ